MIFSFEGYVPFIHPTAFVHPQSTIIGNVYIYENVYIGPGAVVRGDWGAVTIEKGANVQENCVIHMFPGKNVCLKASAHIGHGAIIHGADIGRNCLVGMNAVIMDDVLIEEECIIGALTLITQNTHIPKRSLVVGNPGKIIKTVTDDMIQWKTEGTQLYQSLPDTCRQALIPCEPLTEEPTHRPIQKEKYGLLTKGK